MIKVKYNNIKYSLNIDDIQDLFSYIQKKVLKQ